MTTTPSNAAPERRPKLSPVWLIPLGALLIGLWLAFDHWASQGPTVVLKMTDAEGIEAGKTSVKTRNVQVGQVEEVALSEDLSHTLVTVRMQQDTARMLNDKTRFWVVKPRIGREGISGLGTVLSGAYIELQPGDGKKEKRRFQVEEKPPITEAGAKGLYLTLNARPGSSVATGDPVTYRNLTVGRVVDTEFLAAEKIIRHRIFIEQPYDVLVTESVRFWNVSGVTLQLDSGGFKVGVQSMETLIGGGITFGVPDQDMPAGAPAKPDSEFELYADEEAARRGLFDQYLEYVLLVQDSVRGLRRGAPVEYRGVRLGTVEQVPWHFTADQPETLTRFAIPVLIRIEPQRILEDEEANLDEWRDRLDRMFDHGLRATLKSGNLLTGALFVDLNFQRNAEPFEQARFEGVQVFPSTTGGLAQLESQVAELMDKINSLPLEQIGNKLDRNLAASESTLKAFAGTAERLRQLLEDPAVAGMPERLNDTLSALEKTLAGLEPGSDAYRQLSGTLQRMEQLLRDAEPLMRTLKEHPNALIFSTDPEPDYEPKAAR